MAHSMDIAVEQSTGGGASSASSDDLRLAAAVLERDRKATAEFVALHADSVHAYVRFRLIPRADLVDDLVQEVFLSAWESLPKYQGQAPLRHWLLGIARHKVEDHYRRALRAALPMDEDWDAPSPESAEPVEELLDRTRAEQRVQLALSRLPETYSMILLWRYWEKRPARDMAELTGKTEKAVERMLARARSQFKKVWAELEP